MKNIFIPATVFLLILILSSCGQKSNNQQKATENTEEKSTVSEDKSKEELSAAASAAQNEEPMTPKPAEKKEIVAKFVKFSPSTSGSVFIFEDQNGKEHLFHKARNAEGMDFAMDLEPGIEPAGYENIWFNVVVENREVERAGEKGEEWTILKVEKIDVPDSKDHRKVAFTASDLKNSVFFGDPFWSMHFKDDHLLKSSTRGDVKFLYLKDGDAGNFQLEDAIIPVSPVVVELQVTDEDMGAIAIVTIIRETCSDGESDNDYPFTFSMKWKEDGGGWNGCGRVD